MLKTRHLVILAALVAVLAAVSVGQKASHRKTTTRPSTATLVEGSLDGDAVERITIGHGGDEAAVVLERRPDGWALPTAWDAPASRQKVDGLLQALAGLEGEFRSDRESVLADYGLAGDEAVTIRVFGPGGATAAALDVGRSPEGAQGQFVRRPGENAVYVSARSVLAPLGLYGGPAAPTSRHFLELQAVKEDRLAVDRIVLEDEHGARTLAKVFPEPVPDDSTGVAPEPDRLTWEWSLAGSAGTPLKTKADGVLGGVVSIRAVDVDDPAADPAAYGLDRPARRATMVFADGRELVLAFGAERAAQDDRPAGFWMRAGDDPTVWIVTSYVANNIFKAPADLLPES